MAVPGLGALVEQVVVDTVTAAVQLLPCLVRLLLPLTLAIASCPEEVGAGAPAALQRMHRLV